MLVVTDIYGNTEAVTGYKGLKRKRAKSGERSISFVLYPTKENAHSFNMVQEESLIEFNGDDYRIKTLRERSIGNTKVKEVTAIHTFFDLIDRHVSDVHTGSLTFDAALDFVLSGTGYTWVVLDTFYAEDWEDFGDDNTIALFQEVLNRYEAEFTQSGTHLTFKRKIGNSTDFQFRYGYNVKTIERDVNTNNLSTYIKGYGKLKELQDVLSGEKIPYSDRNGSYYTDTEINQLATDQVGANFTFTFIGTGFTFDTIVTFLGGVWEFTIDGTKRIRISTYKDVVSENKTFEVIRGLEHKAHSVVATFKGKDSKNPYTQYSTDPDPIGYLKSGNIFALYRELTGDEKYEAIAEYTSPNVDKYGFREAQPIQDKRYKSNSSLLNRLKEIIQDEPEISITLDFADLRRAGYPYDVPNEGDDVLLIYEPMDLDVDARIIEIEETYIEAQQYPIQTNVTLANLRKTVTRQIVSFKQTQKQLNMIVEGKKKLPFSVLDDEVKRVTAALQSAQTELEFENGIIARSKEDPNHIVLITSIGIGVSKDNGQTFRTAMTGEGIVADLITVGTMLFDRIKGGTLTLGGALNGNGRMQVFNADGEVIADLDAETGGFQELYIGKLNSPSVYNVNREDKYFDVNTNGGISEVISELEKVNNANITITLLANITDDVDITDFLGNGTINIDLNGFKLNGYIRISGNSTQYLYVYGGTVNSKHPDYCMKVDRCTYVRIENVKMYGNNKAFRGIFVHGGSAAYIKDCEIYDTVSAGIASVTSAHISVKDCKGDGGDYGIHAFDGGLAYIDGTIPGGSISDTKQVSGEVLGTATTDYGAATPPAPPETTTTWYANDSNNWSTSGYWGNDGVKQGNYGYGTRTGLWFFPNDIASTLTGKSIKSMRCYIKRKSSGGTSGKVPIRVHWHTYEDKPSGAPSNLDLSGSEEAVINLAWGQEGWVNLPSSFFNNFESGEAKGLGIYAGSSRSEYAVLDGYCRFEVTYE